MMSAVPTTDTMDFYYMAESPPCRAVLMVAEFLNVKMNLISLDLTKNEQHSHRFTQVRLSLSFSIFVQKIDSNRSIS